MIKNLIVVFPEIGKGGAERIVAEIVNFLIPLNYKITIISLGPPHDYGFLNFSDKIQILHFPRKKKFDFSSFKNIAKVYKEHPNSPIFCVDFFAQLFISVLRTFYNLKFDIILNIHITIPIKKKDYLINFCAARFLKSTDWVVFISENQKKYLRSKFLLSSKCNQTVIYNGIDTNIFKIVEETDKRGLRKNLLNVNETDILIIKVAGIRVEKDHQIAIRALKYFHEKFQYKPILILLGDGDQQLTQQLKRLTSELSLNSYVKFVGFNTNVNQYLACADIFTLTSRGVETFSLAALEAMACGLPAVLTNIGGANEMIMPGINGYLSKARSIQSIADQWLAAIETDFNHEQIRKFIVNNFDLGKMNLQYFNLLNTIYNGS